MNNLYNRIQSLCTDKGLKIAHMCTATGIRSGLMSDLKMGRSKSLSAETLSKIASFFGVSVDYLLGNEEQKEKPTANDGSKLSIDERVEQLLDGMANERSGSLMLDGKLASPEAVEALRQAIKMSVEYARKINSDKK